VDSAAASVPVFWHVIGTAGALIFYGRFYVQWIASERAGRSVMPILFWYMSCLGSVMLMALAVATRSPIGALSQSFNLVPYGRNLLHIWREQGTLTPFRRRLVNVATVVIAVVALYLLWMVWSGEYKHVQKQPDHVAREAWVWLAVGVIGQALFAARFLVQWIATERQRRSVVPAAFWYLSLAAAILQTPVYFHRREWEFAIGMLATIVIYVRNVFLISREGATEAASA
jgi:lipid-A-disaccharide synthase-like uncharacterized protein